MKCLIRNQYGLNQKGGFFLPCGADDASAFCNALLEGSYEVYEEKEKSGKDKVSAYSSIVVTGKSTETNQKATIRFNALSSKNEAEIISALKGHSFDGVKFDEVYIIYMTPVSVA